MRVGFKILLFVLFMLILWLINILPFEFSSLQSSRNRTIFRRLFKIFSQLSNMVKIKKKYNKLIMHRSFPTNLLKTRLMIFIKLILKKIWIKV